MSPVIDRRRRAFLRAGCTGSALLALAACGGGHPIGSPSDGANGPSPAALPSGPPPPAPDPSTGPSPAPSPSPPTSLEAFTWQIASDQTLMLTAGTTITVATGAAGMTATVAPSLPTGRTLSVTTAGHVVILSAPNAPAVDALGPWVVEVAG